jgi:hypothetical protein
MTLLDLALQYSKKGFNVIPVSQNKKPIIKWQKYQSERSTEAEIRSWWKEHPKANIGLVTGEISGIAVIDVDSDKGKEAIQEYIPDSCIMPVSQTPSGGWHYYFKCPDSKLTNNARVIKDCDLRANGGYIIAPPSKNGTGKEYKWLDGLSIFEVETPALPLSYLHYINNNSFYIHRSNNSQVLHSVTSVTNRDKILQLGNRDNDLFHIANCLIKGGMREDFAIQVLEILAQSCFPPFPEKEIHTKIQSALNRNLSKTGTVASEIESWISVTSGDFSVTQCYQVLHLVTKEEKTAARQAIYRLKEAGEIEPTGSKMGHYRKIDKSFEPLQGFTEDVLAPIDIKLPLKLDMYAKIFQSNIVIIAGEKSTGKTGFCLNFTQLNFDSPYPIRYISSEFSGGELYERLEPMGLDPEKWIKRIEFNRFRGEPQDAILPDGINIVDYLEVKDGEFPKVGHNIDKIYDKLEKGMAIICLQKNQGTDLARGGGMTLDKSRLYISLTRQRTDKGLKNYANIVDCKNRQMKEINPNGFFSEYKLGGGYFFKQVTDWRPK